MYFSRQMAQSEVELLLSESEAPQLLSLRPFPLALNFLVSIFSKAWMAILFMELCVQKEAGTRSEGAAAHFVKMCRISPELKATVLFLFLSEYLISVEVFLFGVLNVQKTIFKNLQVVSVYLFIYFHFSKGRLHAPP